MTATHDVQMLKGVLRLALLRLLAERDSYGYELVLRLHDLGLTDIAEGTVYPALGRLEREKLAKTFLVPSDSGPARKYYRLTPAGRRALSDAVAAWTYLAGAIEPLLSTMIPGQPEEAHV